MGILKNDNEKEKKIRIKTSTNFNKFEMDELSEEAQTLLLDNLGNDMYIRYVTKEDDDENTLDIPAEVVVNWSAQENLSISVVNIKAPIDEDHETTVQRLSKAVIDNSALIKVLAEKQLYYTGKET